MDRRARRSCDVVGIDFVPAVLKHARCRAAAEQLAARFTEADAQALPFEDESFDAVLSTFGVMFAPDQERAARELLRVCRRGGRIGLANWTPASYPAQHLALVAEFLPSPAGIRPPTQWGTRERLEQLFGEVSDLNITTRMIRRRFLSAQHCVDQHRRYCGPTQLAFGTLDADAGAALERALLAQVQAFNRSGDATVIVPSEYLEVVATKH